MRLYDNVKYNQLFDLYSKNGLIYLSYRSTNAYFPQNTEVRSGSVTIVN